MESTFLATEFIRTRFRTKKVILVLLGGKAGVGKTTAANYLVDKITKEFPNLQTLHKGFADQVKLIASEAFHWDGKKDERGRRLLQVIGTDAGREYNENIWVEHMENTLLNELFPPNFVFIDDWRFPNEAYYFEKDFLFDLVKIRIERPNNPALLENGMEHISENALPTVYSESLIYNSDTFYNFSIFNNETLEDLYNKLDSVTDYLKTKIVSY